MGDVDHRSAEGDEFPNQTEQPLDLRLVKRLGRLIEHQHPWAADQRLGDLDEVALGNRQVDTRLSGLTRVPTRSSARRAHADASHARGA